MQLKTSLSSPGSIGPHPVGGYGWNYAATDPIPYQLGIGNVATCVAVGSNGLAAAGCNNLYNAPGNVAISRDYGKNWAFNPTSPCASTRVATVAVSGSRIFAGFLVTGGGTCFAYSDDFGESWTQPIPGYSETVYQVVVVAPSVVVLVSSSSARISRDNGTTWQTAAAPLGANGFVAASEDYGVIVTWKSNLLWYSVDKGQTWTSLSTAYPFGGTALPLAVSHSATATRVFMGNGYGNQSYLGPPPIAYSDDFGLSWHNATLSFPSWAYCTELQATENGIFAAIYMAYNQGGWIAQSTDNGVSWSLIEEQPFRGGQLGSPGTSPTAGIAATGEHLIAVGHNSTFSRSLAYYGSQAAGTAPVPQPDGRLQNATKITANSGSSVVALTPVDYNPTTGRSEGNVQAGGHSAWYRFDLPQDGLVELTLTNVGNCDWMAFTPLPSGSALIYENLAGLGFGEWSTPGAAMVMGASKTYPLYLQIWTSTSPPETPTLTWNFRQAPGDSWVPALSNTLTPGEPCELVHVPALLTTTVPGGFASQKLYRDSIFGWTQSEGLFKYGAIPDAATWQNAVGGPNGNQETIQNNLSPARRGQLMFVPQEPSTNNNGTIVRQGTTVFSLGFTDGTMEQICPSSNLAGLPVGPGIDLLPETNGNWIGTGWHAPNNGSFAVEFDQNFFPLRAIESLDLLGDTVNGLYVAGNNIYGSTTIYKFDWNALNGQGTLVWQGGRGQTLRSFVGFHNGNLLLDLWYQPGYALLEVDPSGSIVNTWNNANILPDGSYTDIYIGAQAGYVWGWSATGTLQGATEVDHFWRASLADNPLQWEEMFAISSVVANSPANFTPPASPSDFVNYTLLNNQQIGGALLAAPPSPPGSDFPCVTLAPSGTPPRGIGQVGSPNSYVRNPHVKTSIIVH